MAYEVSSSLRSPDRANFVSLFSKTALILGFVLSFSGRAPAQVLTVTSNGAVVSSGQNLQIDTNPQMPPIDLEVTSACGTVQVQLQLQWFAPAGQGTYYEYPTFSFSTGQQVAIDWTQLPDGPVGGQATLTWGVYSGSNYAGGGNFQFNVNGTNPANADVNFLASSPWFFPNLLSWETLTNTPGAAYHQFTNGGGPAQPCGVLLMCPTVNNNDNGVGIAQLEPPYLCCNHDFWDWSANLGDGLKKLSQFQSTSYANWTNEYSDMLANTGGHPVPANWPSDCTGVNGAVCGMYSPSATYYCNFSSNNANGSSNGFGDGNWIHTYNGSFFVDWVLGVNGGPGHWEYDVQGPNNGYVYRVCTTAEHQ